MRVLGGQQGFLVLGVGVAVFKSVALPAADGTRGRVGPSDAADVDEHRLVPAEEQRQALGDCLLANAMRAVDEDERCRLGVHWPAEDGRGRSGCRDGRTTVE